MISNLCLHVRSGGDRLANVVPVRLPAAYPAGDHIQVTRAQMLAWTPAGPPQCRLECRSITEDLDQLRNIPAEEIRDVDRRSP
jgi:hypothetical protein